MYQQKFSGNADSVLDLSGSAPSFLGDISSSSSSMVEAPPFSDLTNSTVLIRDSIAAGSGFFVDDQGDVATCAHVIYGSSPGASLEITTASGAHYKGTVEKVDYQHDLAIVRVQGGLPKGSTVAGLGDSNGLQTGDALYVFGHPKGVRQVFESSGSFDSYGQQSELPVNLLPDRGGLPTHNANVNDYLKMTVERGNVPIFPGNSGGPVFDTQGQVVGIAAETVSSPSDSQYIPVNYLRNLLTAPSNQGAPTYQYVGSSLYSWRKPLPGLFFGAGSQGLSLLYRSQDSRLAFAGAFGSLAANFVIVGSDWLNAKSYGAPKETSLFACDAGMAASTFYGLATGKQARAAAISAGFIAAHALIAAFMPEPKSNKVLPYPHYVAKGPS